MLCRKINVAPAKIKRGKFPAFSLIEILISLVLGSLLLLSLSTLYSQFLASQIKQDERLLLQKEAHQLINYFQQHIQHLGYQGQARADSNFSFFEQNGQRYALVKPSCFIFFYDLNNDGCLGKRATKNTACTQGELNNTKELAKEIFGFKLENKEIYLYADNQLINCSREQCKSLLSSCGNNWTKLTSSELFQVTDLAFSWKKQDQLLQIDLALASVKSPQINYHVTAYTYILNTL